jgi:hypothetical protein
MGDYRYRNASRNKDYRSARIKHTGTVSRDDKNTQTGLISVVIHSLIYGRSSHLDAEILAGIFTALWGRGKKAPLRHGGFLDMVNSCQHGIRKPRPTPPPPTKKWASSLKSRLLKQSYHQQHHPVRLSRQLLLKPVRLCYTLCTLIWASMWYLFCVSFARKMHVLLGTGTKTAMLFPVSYQLQSFFLLILLLCKFGC